MLCVPHGAFLPVDVARVSSSKSPTETLNIALPPEVGEGKTVFFQGWLHSDG
jgi:hypothetical protein